MRKIKKVAKGCRNPYDIIHYWSGKGYLSSHKKYKLAKIKTAHLEMEKKLAVLRAQHSCEEKTQSQIAISMYVRFLEHYALVNEKARKMINKIRAKDHQLGDEYQAIVQYANIGMRNISESYFTPAGLQEIVGYDVDTSILTSTDRLMLTMFANGIDTRQIAALLNTTTYNLKTRKSYLKNKIKKKASPENGLLKLLPFFEKCSFDEERAKKFFKIHDRQ